MHIHFEQADLDHKDTIFQWLQEPHVQEFWDNSQAHKDDILSFLNGRKQPSDYFDGLFTYWIGSIDDEPYCLIMTLHEQPEYEMPALKKSYLSKKGNTYSLDYTIGNTSYVGKGLGAKTLEMFIDFLRKDYDSRADTFFIDPAATNSKAKHVYEKAGFEHVGNFSESKGVFAGSESHFLVKRIL